MEAGLEGLVCILVLGHVANIQLTPYPVLTQATTAFQTWPPVVPCTLNWTINCQRDIVTPLQFGCTVMTSMCV